MSEVRRTRDAGFQIGAPVHCNLEPGASFPTAGGHEARLADAAEREQRRTHWRSVADARARVIDEQTSTR